MIIGVGNTGAKLATLLDKNAMLFSTAKEDSRNFVGSNIVIVSEDGASKRFKKGLEIWKEHENTLKDRLKYINNDKVVLFVSLGGGSGSSSLSIISKILLEQNNKILIVGVIPFPKENNPPLANAVQSISALLPLINKVSIILFDNNHLMKKFENNWGRINHHIVKRVDYILNILKKYNTDDYSPVTLDQSELESVVFGGGFIDISDDFIEEKIPKFEYGKLDRNTKNCLLAMFVDNKIEDKDMDKYQGILTNVIGRVSSRAPNARLIPGILRASLNFTNSKEKETSDRAYLTIASGLSIENYMKRIEKLRDNAIKKASKFSEREEVSKILDNKDSKILDL